MLAPSLPALDWLARRGKHGWVDGGTGTEGRGANSWIRGVLFVNSRKSLENKKLDLDHGQSTRKALNPFPVARAVLIFLK